MIKEIDNLIQQNKWEKYLTKQYFNYFVLAIFGFLGLYLDRELKEIILLLFLVWLFLNPVKSWMLARVALLCFILTAILLVIKQENRANTLAEAAYLFVLLAVGTAAYELYGKKKE